jgi:L-alanine-DL-glutamate epimerase-like enolase superfamily enzyme
MRLAEYQLHVYHLPYERPVKWSDIVEAAAPFVLLALTSDTGTTGVAEITVKPTWCGVTARSLIATVEEIFIPLLKTLDLADPAKVRARLDAVPENQAAKTLIDNGCWDLYAAERGEPLWKLWNGNPRVELSWAVTRQAPQAMADEAARMVERYGFRVLKVKGGQGFEVDVAGLNEIRAATSDRCRYYVDANGAYTPEQALDYTKAMADAGAVVMEDPSPLAPDSDFERLRDNSPIPILVDFGCTSLRDAGLFLERNAQALSVKPGRFGLTHARAMHAKAQKSNCKVVAGLMGESYLGTLAGLQFSSTIAEPHLPSELTWFLAMTRQPVTTVPHISDGILVLPDTPSLGSMVDWDVVKNAG